MYSININHNGIPHRAKILNGCNHALEVYFTHSYCEARPNYKFYDPFDKRFIIKEGATPSFVIPRPAKPINFDALPVVNGVTDMGNLMIFSPEINNALIKDNKPTDYQKYDIIVVSSVYAKYIKQLPGIPLDFLDRLYTSVPLYGNSSNGDMEKKGCVGLQKMLIIRPEDYINYINNINSSFHPSFVSVAVTISHYKKYRSYPYQNLEYLENFLSNYHRRYATVDL